MRKYNNWYMSLLLLSGMLYGFPLMAQHGKIIWSAPIRLPLGLAGPLTGVDHGMLLVGGGCNFPDSMPWAGGKKKYYNELYIVDLHRRKLIATTHLPEQAAYGASVTTPRGVAYIGGENEQGISNRVYCLSWNEDLHVERWPDLPEALTNASAALLGHTIYVAGGETMGGVSDKLYALDLTSASLHWVRVAALPKPLSHTVMIAAGHRLFLVGGRKKNPGSISDLSRSVYSFDTVGRRWSECRDLPYPLSAGTGVLYDEQHLLLLGGDKGEVFHRVEELIAAVDKTSDASERQKLLLEKARVQSAHPGFSKDLLIYDMRMNKWSVFDSLSFPSPATTTAVRWENCILVPGGEIKAGVRSPEILIGEISR
jgi:cyclically-permuted mutarotase family protein